jgi:hypothetical protein
LERVGDGDRVAAEIFPVSRHPARAGGTGKRAPWPG